MHRRSPRLPVANALVGLLGCLTLLVACAGGSSNGGRTVLLSDDDAGIPSAGGAARRQPRLSTRYDDKRVGDEAAEDVATQLGLLGDAELDAYITRIGNRLLRGAPRQGFRYQFSVVDQIEPNAFALPGGHIFISRGLLALVNTEDELANVIGHEITNAASRHAAASQAVARAQNPLTPPWMRAANMAAYSRDMERDADRGGQMLAAAAGYDPMGMSTFLASLGQWQQLEAGPRGPSFFDTHPGSVERASTNAMRASELRPRKNPALGDTRQSLLAKVEGLPVGPRREGGVFLGDRFLHPSLGFQMRFPDGWRLQNTNQAVGAMSPHRDAIIYLTADLPPGDLEKVGTDFLQKMTDGRAKIRSSQPVKLGSLDAWRIEAEAASGQGQMYLLSTFFVFRDGTWRITGMTPALISRKHQGQMLATMRSFRPLSVAESARIRDERLHVVSARRGEDLEALGHRTGNQWSPLRTSIANALASTVRFQGGEQVKIARVSQ
ncbi:MAG: M48 family metalloprotease [Myxococcota bacterium]